MEFELCSDCFLFLFLWRFGCMAIEFDATYEKVYYLILMFEKEDKFVFYGVRGGVLHSLRE